MDSPVMQIKKMKDVGQQLYTAHTSDGCSPATMSPKALGAHRTARAQRPEPPGLMYAGSEAEATLTTLATCAKCKGVQEIPIHELKKTQRADKYICFQCTLSLAPTAFHFGSGNPGSLRGNQAQLAPGSGSNKFKVRNFKPGKYYCDKCRFSTKDPLQYKKHITQHDEIRFICSHCSYVSYTKGEFQRHLVKHTGIFPYQCEYCDYGAVRNDYIVKHRKRVHERAGSRRPPGPTTKLEARRAGTAKPYPELGKSPGPRREMTPSRLAPPLSKFPTHPRRDKAHGSPWLPDPKDLQKDVVCVPKRLGLAEPSEAALFENKSVEVEVLSPAREPLQPGMPLTVVAPSELVVPANCLAQLMDVKVVNGTQQVLLKLFPLEEGSALEARPVDGEVGEQGPAEQGAMEQGAVEQGVSEPRKGGAAEPTVPPVGDGRVERLAAGMRSLPVSLQKRLRSMTWLRPYDLLMSQPGPSEPPLAPEDLQERSALCPYQAALPSLASKGPFPPPSVVKNSVFCGLGGGPSSFPYRATAAALSEERQHPPRDSKRLLPLSPPPLALPFSGEQAPLPRSKGDMESRRKLGVPGKGVPSSRKLKDSPVELSTGSGRKLKDSLTEPSMGSGWKLKDSLMEPSVGSGRKLKDSLMEPSVGSGRKLKDSLMEPSMGSGRKLKDGPMEPSTGSGRKLKDGLMEPSLGSGWKLKDNPMEPSMSSGRKLKNGPMEPSMGSGWKLKHSLTEPSAGTGRKLKDGPTEPSTSTGWKLKDGPTEPSMGSAWKLMDGLMESSVGSGWKLTDSLMEPSVGSGWKLTDSLMEPSMGSGWKLKDSLMEPSTGSCRKLKDGPMEPSTSSCRKLKDSPMEPSAGSSWKLKDGPTEPSMGPAPAQCLSEHLQISLAGEETTMAPQPGDGPLELTTAEKLPDSFEGPVISSVFSLSSGSEDVPEGIRWGSSTAKVKSVELLRRKIAKLIESCGSLRSNPTGPSKALSKATPEKTPEVSVSAAGPSHASASPPAPPDVPAVEGPSLHTQVQPQPAAGSGKAEGRGGRRTRAATPVSAPKGAVLRLQDSPEDAHVMEATCDTLGTIPHSETQSGKPASSRPTRQTEADLQCSASEGRPGGLAPTPDTSLRPKPRKENTMCGVSPRRNGALGHGPQGLGDSGRHRKLLSRSLPPNKNKGRQGSAGKKKGQGQAEIGRALKDPSIFQVARQLRLVAAKPDQLIKCPRRNQPVIVLNHPDVDSPEVTNVMKVINKYKGNVLKVVLSERTRCQLGIRRHHVRLTYQNAEEANQIKRQMMLKMKLKKVHKNNYQVVDALPDDAAQCLFKCWFCGRLYEDQEEWMSHGQRHLIEATRDWDVLSSKSK